MNRILSSAAMALLLAIPLAACVQSDDGDHVTVVPELEPNETAATATQLNGGTDFYVFTGECNATNADGFDWFEVDALGGKIDLTLYVADHPPGGNANPPFAAASPVTLAYTAMDEADAVIAEAPSVTPATPASLHATLGAPGKMRMKIVCPSTNGWYVGTVRLP